VLGVEPDNVTVLSALGDIALANKDFDGARRYLDRQHKLQPDSPKVLYKQGIVSLQEKKIEDARSFFEKALRKDPDFVPALNQLVNIDIGNNAIDNAIKRCEQQISERPANAGYYVLLGRLYASKKQDRLARKNYEKALDLDPNHPEALFRLAQIEQSSGSFDEALARYEKIREKNPEHLGTAMIIAALLEKKGEHDKAKAIYEEVLKKDPDSSAAGNNLAFYYAEHEPTSENLAKAEELIEPLIQKHKNSPHILDTAAWVYYRQGKYEKARDLLISVEDKSRDMPSINYHLGMIYLELGEKKEAEKYLRLALKSETPFPEKETAQNALHSLNK